MEFDVEVILCQVVQAIVVVQPHKRRHKIMDNECPFSFQSPLEILNLVHTQHVSV